MRKIAICCLALVVVAMLVPAAQATTKTYCYVLTNFCDRIQVTQTSVGGATGIEVVGLWDWLCLYQGTGTFVSGTINAFGTQPLYPYSGGTGSGFSANFKFRPVTKTFDLYGTFDGLTAFAFQTNQPYTRTNGPCNPLHAKSGLRPATVR